MVNRLWLAALVFALLAVSVFAAGGGGGPVVVPEKPAVHLDVTAEEASSLKCSTLTTVQERVSCRIGLPEENEFDYLPEECRSLDGNAREKCKGFYSSVQKCWVGENLNSPVGCARRVLGLGSSVSEAVAACKGKRACLSGVAASVDSLNKFRLYNLEWKAEYAAENEGVDVNHELLVDLIVNLERKKLEYNAALTVAEKKLVLLDAQRLWRSFVSKVGRGV